MDYTDSGKYGMTEAASIPIVVDVSNLKVFPIPTSYYILSELLVSE
jgi:hypothetical protein